MKDFPLIVNELWKRRLWIICIPLTMAMIAGLLSLSREPTYGARLIYQTSDSLLPLDGVSLTKLFSRFYAHDNQERLKTQLQADAPEMALWMSGVVSEKAWRTRFDIRVIPDYIDYRNKANLKITFDRVWADNIEKLEDLTAQMLEVVIKGAAKNETHASVAAFRHNLEQQIGLYLVRDNLISRISTSRIELSKLTSQDPQDQWSLEKATAIADELQKQSSSAPLSFQLQLDLEAGQFDMLPAELQASYFETEATRIEQYAIHRRKLIGLHEKTIHFRLQLVSYIDQLLAEMGSLKELSVHIEQLQVDPDVQTHLQADYLDCINLSQLLQPTNAYPMITREPRGTTVKTAFAFLMSLMLTLLWIGFQIARSDETT